MSKPSRIFSGYRALGFVSNQVPLSLRYISRRKENLVVTAVGKCFHTYGCDKLTLLSVSNPHPDEIKSIASDSYLVFTSCKNVIYAWRRGTELKHEYKCYEADVHLLLPFGPHLIAVDTNSTLFVWDIKSGELILELAFSNRNFSITAVLHPSTYLNKILLGSRQGQLQLWNLRTNKLVYEFKGWNSAVTVMEQAPAIDVVAIGLANGDIYVHNLKFDETVMKFSQEWGPITAISFRTDGRPIMSSGSSVGHIAVWNLDKKRLHSEIRDAHRGSVTGMKFLPNEPLMVTSSPDNTLKMWLFDLPDEGGRLLRLREGHCEPPLKIHFHGSSGENILSSGLDSTLRSFSTAANNLNKNLGQASFNRKVAKKKGIKNDPGKMTPIVDFTSEIAREKEWDNIVACHRDLGIATTWSYDNCRMGEHKLMHERFIGEKNILALCITLSACGNFVLIGYSSGHVDKFNVQSGLFRGTFGQEKAHEGSVRGIVSDELNQVATSGGSDKILKFWRFKDGTLLSSLSLEHMISKMIIHRENSVIAVALDNFTVIVVDQHTKRIVRRFEEHCGRISDMAFSPDSHWLIVASMDSLIRTWDMRTGRLLDCFSVSPVCVSLTMSPTSNYLATAHAGDLGIYLWINKTLYSHIPLQPLPAEYEPKCMDLPSISLEGDIVIEEEMEESEMEICVEDNIVEYQSPEQIDKLVTLSLLPHSRWQNLMNLDIIKMRNKPKEPLKVPKNAPFFLPVVSGLKPTFAVEEKKGPVKKDDSVMLRVLQQSSSFAEFLIKCEENESFDAIISKLKDMSPSLMDVELRCLAPENGGSVFAMLSFMKALDYGLQTHKDFELLQSILVFFLQMHGDFITSEERLRNFLEILQNSQSESWQSIYSKFNQCLAVIKYIRSSVL